MTWIGYIIGACCIIWGLLQTRTAFVYMGILKSAVIPEYETRPVALIHSAVEGALTSLICGVLLFMFTWPKVITYILLALLFKSFVNLVLALLRVGGFSVPKWSSWRGRANQVLLKTGPVVYYGVAVWAAARFLGH